MYVDLYVEMPGNWSEHELYFIPHLLMRLWKPVFRGLFTLITLKQWFPLCPSSSK